LQRALELDSARLASNRRREPDPVAMVDALLAERYAWGEIDEQEHARRRTVLQGER